MTRVIPVVVVVIALGVAVAFWLAFRTPLPSPAQPPPTSESATPLYDEVRADALRLPVKGWDRDTDFRRSAFGEAWSDDVDVEFGHNGCNTRDDVLRRDLADLVVRPGTCYAQSGTLHDPYSGVTIAFIRGPTTSDVVQIDHLVSLSDAWYKGARGWDRSTPSRLRERPAQLAGRRRKGQLRQGISGCGQLAAAQRCVPVRVRRESRRGEDCLRPLGVGQGEARHHRRAGRLLAHSVAPKRAPFRRNRRPCRQLDR